MKTISHPASFPAGQGLDKMTPAAALASSQKGDNIRDLPLTVRLRRFVCAIAGLIAIIYLAQYPIKLIPAFQTCSDVVDKNNFIPGALYYTDVHVTAESEKFVRHAIKVATTDRKTEPQNTPN